MSASRKVAACMAAGVLTVSGGGYAAAHTLVGKVEHIKAFGSLTDRPAADRSMNILLVGSDDRSGLSRKQRRKMHAGTSEYGRHTDTILIVHVSAHGHASVVSIPRDSYAEIPAYVSEDGTKTPKSEQKINAAYSIGGPELTVATVEKATGLHIDHYAEIDFAGFVSMVNALDGIEVCSSVPISDANSGLELPAGKSTLKGRKALAYVRARYFDPSADIGRMKRQQKFIASIVERASSPAVLLNPIKLNKFVSAALSSVRTDPGLDHSTALELAARLGRTGPAAVAFATVPYTGERALGYYGNVLEWDKPAAEELFAKLRDDVPITQGGPKKPLVEIAPGEITVSVLNASGIEGRGGQALQDLKQAGFNVSGTAGTADSPVATTTIEYDPAYSSSIKTVLASLPGATAVEVPGLGGTFRISVGPDYSGVTAVRTATATDANAPRTAAEDICS